jgi:hypothetical protein
LLGFLLLKTLFIRRDTFSDVAVERTVTGVAAMGEELERKISLLTVDECGSDLLSTPKEKLTEEMLSVVLVEEISPK